MLKTIITSATTALATIAATGALLWGTGALDTPSSTAHQAAAAVAPATSGTSPTVAAAPTPSGHAGTTAGVNLNTATADELEALPGIGKATAAKIIAARPIATVDAVDGLPGVNAENYAKFHQLVTV